jgi:hypothetical protein
MNEEIKKMAFYEIGKGKFSQNIQEDFERAQVVSNQTGLPVKITAEIIVYPPERSEENYGAVAFGVKTTLPARKSMKYTTELKDGFIISDGNDISEILQTRLEFPDIVMVDRKTGVEKLGDMINYLILIEAMLLKENAK